MAEIKTAEIKTKEGELTQADLAAYGIPPKPDGLEVEVKERAGMATNGPDVVSDEAVEKVGRV